MKKKFLKIILIILFIGFTANYVFRKFNFNQNYQIGDKIDSLNGVFVYYNGGVNHILERNKTEDGYNLGMKYQCVEFVKRYYYERYHHKMPDSYGNAKDFFDNKISDGQKNEKRNLIQFRNSSSSKPQIGDLMIYSATIFNKFGHVAIVSEVNDSQIEIIQQNPGPFSPSREHLKMKMEDEKWKIKNSRILGWLRKE
ncbi:CHAP domain-containing protein [Chryseobacterium sp.]|uniref:CHAP domain-containing protein n=1 Tax=Chryseobacterium sp. TaxID=1871047 RepID=UPI0023F1A822|nr:CHAP domain-containing protein [Chryseobacterium sp.]